MSGKTQIDITLRNQLVEFIGDLDLQGEQALKAQDLYGRLKPQRKRTRKVIPLTVETGRVIPLTVGE